MKYILLILLLSSYTIELNAQVPQKMSYQAIIRDANNNLLSLKNINIRISIIRGEFDSITVYSEIQSGKTNLNGLVSLQIGTGILKTGDFKKIDWSKGPYFIKTETDPDGGFDFKITGSSELLSVPYALYALNNTAGFDTTSLHNRIIDLQFQAEENKKNNKKNLDSIIDNAKDIKKNLDSINLITSEIHIIIDSVKENAAQSEINILGIKENAAQIHIALDSIRANSVKTKNIVDTLNTKIDILDLIAILSSYQKVGKIINAFTVDTIDSIDIKSNGNLHSSKNIALSGNIESLGVNSSIGTIEKPFKDLYISSNSLFIASDIVGQNIPPTILSNLNGNLQISSGGFKLMGENVAFIAPKFEGRLTGNANTATKLETSRRINGILFDGSSDIILPVDNYDDFYIKKKQLNGTDSFNIQIKGNLGSSGNVTVAGNIEALGSTSTLGTIDKPFKGLYISSGSLSIASDTIGLNIPAAVLSNVEGNLQISAGGLKLMGENTSFIAPRVVSTLTGNASTATKLETSRRINGMLFDGSSDITIASVSANALTYTNTGTGDLPGGTYDGSIAKTISYNSLGASPLVGSSSITTVGTLSAGSIPYTLLTGTVPIWNQSTSGNAATVTTNANLTGIVTSIGNVTSIASGTITNSMLSNPAVANLSGTNTGDESSTSIKTKLGVTTLSGDNTGDQTNITGNAATATKLAATKLINNVAFDGSSDITITAIANAATLSGTTLNGTIVSSALTSVGTLSNLTVSNPITGSITGNAATVTTNANLTGVVTSIGNATSIASGTITNSMLANTAVANLTGINTGDETTATIKTKLSITTLTGSNTGDQVLPTLASLGGVASNTAITGATKTKITYDSKGLVTAGADATTADIAASTNKNYVTDIQAGVISNTSGTNTGDQTNITGNAATVTTNANLTGVVTSVGNVTSIASGTITNSMIANTAVANLSGTNTGDQTNITGNAGTATKLENTRLINGVAFDGSSDITITAVANAGTLSGTTLNASIVNSSLTSVGTLGNLTVSGIITGTLSGTATSANNVTTNANLTGVVTSLGNVTSIASGIITNSMIANTAVANLSGTNTGDQTSITGNAGTATKLAATKLINGVAFDGSSDITITAVANAGTLSGTTLNASIVNSSLTSVGTLGNLTVSGIITGTLSGTATSANTVTTNANLTGVVTSVGNVTSIASGTITNSMIANTAVANLTGINTGDQTSITGNAGTATKLENTRLINGVAFDGSSDITITAVADAGTLSGTILNGTIVNSSLTSVGTLGNLTVINPIAGSVTGNAATATTATTAGTASTVTTNANLTGVVTSVGNVTSIASGTITNSMIANTAVANLSGTNTGDQTSITGNAGTATKLENTRLINGVAFDGSSDITITAVADAGTLSGTILNGTIVNSSLTSVGTLGNLTVINPIAGSVTGNAATATTATTAGTASTVTTNANLTGVVTSVGNVTSIASGTITNSMIANTAVANLSGTNTGDQVLPTLASLGGVASNTAITGDTKTKITYDTKGLVTAGTDATTADIAASANRNYITDVQAGVISNTSGTNTGDQTSVTGNAGTATKLAASKLINGVAFDGSSDITITAVADAGTLSGTTLNTTIVNSSLTSVGTLDNLNVSGIITGTLSGTSNNVSGIVAIGNGGTNSTATPTAGGINYGTGTAQAYTAVGTSGQFLQSNGTGTPVWVAQPGPASVTILTSLTPNSTYNVPLGVKAIMVELIGAGGGSGGSVAANTQKGSASGGGGSGTYTRKLIIAPSASYVYTIGIAGAGGSTLGTNGGDGGGTSFIGTSITASGGKGGQGCTASTTGNGGFLAKAGGVGGLIGANGDFSVPGHAGGVGFVLSTYSIGGDGANSFFGDGPGGSIVITAQSTGIAHAATGYGAGASGSAVLFGAALAGAAGYQGVIIITEYK